MKMIMSETVILPGLSQQSGLQNVSPLEEEIIETGENQQECVLHTLNKTE